MSSQPVSKPAQPVSIRSAVDLGEHAQQPVYPGEHLRLPAKLIAIDRSYQRPPSTARVARIAREWLSPAPIRVSDRVDAAGAAVGQYYVYDGQHRLIAFIARFGPEAAIDCWVEPITRDEESRRFALQYQNVVRVMPAEILRALASSGDPVSIGALALMERFALVPNQTLRGVATFVALFQRDHLVLEITVGAMREAWGAWDVVDQPPAVLYAGLFDVLFYHGSELERARLLEVLSKTPPKTILFKGLSAQPGVTKLTERGAYDAVLELYNGARREGRLAARQFPTTVTRRQVGDQL